MPSETAARACVAKLASQKEEHIKNYFVGRLGSRGLELGRWSRGGGGGGLELGSGGAELVVGGIGVGGVGVGGLKLGGWSRWLGSGGGLELESESWGREVVVGLKFP